jgi:hypothetical protein
MSGKRPQERRLNFFVGKAGTEKISENYNGSLVIKGDGDEITCTGSDDIYSTWLPTKR